MVEFKKFNKIPRLSRDVTITEKIDGTSGLVYIGETLSEENVAAAGLDWFQIAKKIEDNNLGQYTNRALDTIRVHLNFQEHNEQLIKLFGDDLPTIIEILRSTTGKDGEFMVGSRNRWLDEHKDNYGFYHWVADNKTELLKLGQGYHYGEWMGNGIQRGYGLKEKRFYLFNTSRWNDPTGLITEDVTNRTLCPSCCYVVPILYQGLFDTNKINETLENLKINGSRAVRGFMHPEGVVIYHHASRSYFKKTIENDGKPKGLNDN
jgi:hypothetical protein